MRKLPSLRALYAFEAAARHGSFGAAAVELGVTPTAVSHQIRLLEDACGRTLFQRRPRPLVLTPAGKRLYPALRDGFDALASAVASLDEDDDARAPLRVTSPNAFASKWLVPRLPKWREAYPAIPLEIIGTDAVLDLRAGAADVAIRYARTPPANFKVQEIFRDTYFPVCSPQLLEHHGPLDRAADLLNCPLIHYDWMNRDPAAPTWREWLRVARSVDPDLPNGQRTWDLSFREELHAIDAVVGGQGIAICSDVVVSHELKSGSLVKAHPLSLAGYGFHLVAVASNPRTAAIEAFCGWLRSVRDV